MALIHTHLEVPYDVTGNRSISDVTMAVTSAWNDTFSTGTIPLRPIEGPNMPMFRFICEVVLSFPIAAFGICGNLLAFVVLCKQKQRLTTNVLLQALAVADTLVLISAILLRSMRYVGWDAFNNVHHYIFVALYPCVYFFRMADTWLTVMMTIDRYIAVCHPLQAQSLCSLRRTYITIAVIILATLIFSLPRFFEFELTGVDDFATGFIHTMLVRNQTYTLAYKILLFLLVMYMTPMVLLIVLNIRLICTLRQAHRHRHFMVSNGRRLKGKGGPSNPNNASRGVTVIVVTIVIVCVICNVIAMTAHVLWALQMCFRSLRYLEIYRRFISNISNVMVTFNCAINFVIYCMCSRKFRIGLTQLFHCESLRNCTRMWRSDRNSESSGTANTSYFSMGRWPSRVSFKNNKLAVQQNITTAL